MKVIYAKTTPLVKVDKPVIGSLYHLSWAKKHGMVWRLVGFLKEGKVLLETPKTKKTLIAYACDLRHTRNNQRRIELGREPI